MKALTLLALFALAPACTPTAAPLVPEGKGVPVVIATEEQDEWLYANCKFLGPLDTTSWAGAAQAASRGASVGEIIYEAGGAWHLSLFACRPNPSWAGGEKGVASAETPKAPPPAEPKHALVPQAGAKPVPSPEAEAKPVPSPQAGAKPSPSQQAGPKPSPQAGSKPKPTQEAGAKWL